jgi:hypothetical protein
MALILLFVGLLLVVAEVVVEVQIVPLDIKEVIHTGVIIVVHIV